MINLEKINVDGPKVGRFGIKLRRGPAHGDWVPAQDPGHPFPFYVVIRPRSEPEKLHVDQAGSRKYGAMRFLPSPVGRRITLGLATHTYTLVRFAIRRPDRIVVVYRYIPQEEKDLWDSPESFHRWIRADRWRVAELCSNGMPLLVRRVRDK